MIEHAFKAAPYYPNRCDVRVEDGGRRTQCAASPSEHADDVRVKAAAFAASADMVCLIETCSDRDAHELLDGLRLQFWHPKESLS